MEEKAQYKPSCKGNAKAKSLKKFFSPLLLVIGLSPSPALFQLEILSHSPLSRIYAFLFFWARLWCSLAITSTR